MTTPAPEPDPTPPEEPTPTDPTPPEEGGQGGKGNYETLVNDPEALFKSHEKYRHENASLRKRLDAADAEQEKIRQANLSEQEKAIEEAYQRGVEETKGTLGVRLLQQQIIAQATGKLVDPTDAVSMLPLDDLDVDKPDDIDKAIEELVKQKPHLAAGNGQRGIDQGPQGRPVDADATGADWLRSVARSS
jgi:hypothetical protein